MKVLHVISNLNKGGAELMLSRLVANQKFKDAGVKFHIISLQDEGALAPVFRAHGVIVHAVGVRHALLIPVLFFRLWLLIWQIKPDLVQTWMVHSDFLGGLAARFAGVRAVVWGVRTTDYSVESRSTRLVRWLCARCSSWIPVRVVCAAHASLKNSLEAGYSAEKLMVIHNGFDVLQMLKSRGRGKVIRQNLDIDDGTCLIGCLGRYNPAKDHANFVYAAGLLAAKFRSVHFLMVGRGVDPGNSQLMAQIRATGYSERFLLIGERNDPAACLDAMNVFVLSSCTEGFPNVLGEAMAMRLPCVSTDVGDAALLMGGREWLVPAGNSKSLAEKLTQLLTLPIEDREKLGDQAAKRVSESFSMDAAAEQFLSLYNVLVKNKRQEE